jgi:hypothetical protein
LGQIAKKLCEEQGIVIAPLQLAGVSPLVRYRWLEELNAAA